MEVICVEPIGCMVCMHTGKGGLNGQPIENAFQIPLPSYWQQCSCLRARPGQLSPARYSGASLTRTGLLYPVRLSLLKPGGSEERLIPMDGILGAVLDNQPVFFLRSCFT